MNYIFLDIDGVMNNRHDWLRKVTMETEKFENHRMFCDEAWELLGRLCYQANAGVILSSSWRYYLVDQDGYIFPKHEEDKVSTTLMQYFRNHNIMLCGLTEKSDESRGKQIQKYVKEHLGKKAKYVVIDDESFDIKKYVKKNQFIQTSFEEGLLERHCVQALKYLTGEEELK